MHQIVHYTVRYIVHYIVHYILHYIVHHIVHYTAYDIGPSLAAPARGAEWRSETRRGHRAASRPTGA